MKLYVWGTGRLVGMVVSKYLTLEQIEGFVEAYKHTSLKLVLDRMIKLDNVVIKQGYFPESLGGMEDKFALQYLVYC